VDGEPSTVFQAMRERVWSIDANLPIGRIGTVREGLARSIDEQPFYATLLGRSPRLRWSCRPSVYGVTSYAASQRRREIGIRVAIGAHARDVERLIRQGLVPSMIGIAAGLAVALAFARVMRSLVFGLSVMDPAVYAATAVTLAVVSVVATWTPARRASRVDPIVVLRNE
jgi:hypothetical protein